MDALSFFRTRYDDLHARMTDDLLAGLDDERLRRRPHPAVNTIAWLLWHMARGEDIAVNRFVADRAQVLDEAGWRDRLAVDRRDLGTGMDDGEVDDLSARIDLDALRGYWAAVGRRTLDVVTTLGAPDLDGAVTAEHARRVTVDEGAAGGRAPWLADGWAGRPRGWFLNQLALVHPYGHLYEGRVVKGLWGLRGR
jgi:hypothetical protein